jgi:hypothetical protein
MTSLEQNAFIAAKHLAFALQQISDYHWGTDDMIPTHVPTQETLELLDKIEKMIQNPIFEIRSAL